MRVLLDTDVILDVMLAREPFAQAARQLLDLCEQGRFEGYMSAITPLNIFYIARKAKSTADLRQAIQELLQTVRVYPIDHSILTSAFGLPFTDFEDAVQCASAQAGNLDAIITRNLNDYQNATIHVFSPKEFLKQLTS